MEFKSVSRKVDVLVMELFNLKWPMPIDWTPSESPNVHLKYSSETSTLLCVQLLKTNESKLLSRKARFSAELLNL